MPKIYLFLILSLLFVKSNAQKNTEGDYIITTNGEQISGEVKLQSLRENQQSCTFKAKGQNNYQTFTAAQLKAFYTRKTYFASKIIPDSSSKELLFLECYLQGKYSLYGRGNSLYIEYDGEPLRPIKINGGVVSKDGIMVKRADGEFLEFLQRLSSECAGLGLQIQANVQSYDLKSFLDLLEDYHNCLKVPYKRFGVAKESYRFQWEIGIAGSTAQMPLKPSFMGLDFYNLMLHNGVGFSANGAMILSPQRFIFFPSLVIAPEWGQYTYHQNDARYIDDLTLKSTYIESHYRANFLAIPIYLRQPFARIGKGFFSAEIGVRLESLSRFFDVEYLIETEGTVERQYSFVETALFNSFTNQAQGFKAGVLTGARFSFGDQNDANGTFALGFRYSRVANKDATAGPFDQPLLLRNSLYSIYLAKKF
jgi:hypothetical protein